MASPKPPKFTDIVLVAKSGDVDPGTEYRVTPNEPVPIGRSARGLTLLDPLVSIQHARISFDLARGYIIQDLNSATGTWVDEECIKGESRLIGNQTQLRFGDTVFEVRDANRLNTWMRVVGGVSLALVALAVVAWLIQQTGASPRDILLREPINVVAKSYNALQPDDAFLRTRGVSMSDIAVKRVRDWDDNGISEVWLQIRNKGDVLITFEETARNTSSWKVLGEFPPNCILPSDTEEDKQGFLPLQCSGTTWMMFEDGRYGLQDQEGVVVYYREHQRSMLEQMGLAGPSKGKGKHVTAKLGKSKKPQPKPFNDDPSKVKVVEDIPTMSLESGPLKVMRLALRNPDGLASFLTERNLPEPVHYVICEGAFEGIVAQALSSNGNIQRLNKGCLNGLKLSGNIEAEVAAVAVSAIGHQALIDDVVSFYAGDPQGLFLPAKYREVRRQLEQSPGAQRGGYTLVANEFNNRLASFDPKPDPFHDLPQRWRRLEYLDQVITPAPVSPTYPIVATGINKLAIPGSCADLRIRTSPFLKRGWRAVFGGTFIEVADVGCGNRKQTLMRIPYSVMGTTVRDAALGAHTVRVVVEARPSGRGSEITRARITFRDERPVLPPPE